jgi:LysM repeat protein
MSDRPTLLTRPRPEDYPFALVSDRVRRVLLGVLAVAGLALYALVIVLALRPGTPTAEAAPAPTVAAAPTAGVQAGPPPAPRQPVTPRRPATPPAEAQPPATRTYRVAAGDTLATVALRHGVDYRRIAVDNQLANPNLIRPGQLLRIGQPAPEVHLIRPGDTLSGIAGQTGLTVRQLRELNPWITNPNRIPAGLGLRVRA